MPATPISESASRTSSSLNGFIIAVTNFIAFSPINFKLALLLIGRMQLTYQLWSKLLKINLRGANGRNSN